MLSCFTVFPTWKLRSNYHQFIKLYNTLVSVFNDDGGGEECRLTRLSKISSTVESWWL